jgi:hypothetical protein
MQISNNKTLSDWSQPTKLVSIAINKSVCGSGQTSSTKHLSSPHVSTIGSDPSNHEELASSLDLCEGGNYSTSFKQSMKTVVLQSFSHQLVVSHFDDGVNSKSTQEAKICCCQWLI